VRPYFPDGLDSRIGLASEEMRNWLMREIQNAQKHIIMYNQTIRDEKILALLKKKADV
jgi:hypothetical protein